MPRIKPLLKDLANQSPIYVSPDLVTNMMSVNVKPKLSLKSNWEKYIKPVKKGNIYKSFKMRLNGAAWEDTPMYFGQAPKKLRNWDRMLNDIVPNGYTFRPLRKNPIDEYMAFFIDENGDFLIYNGIHRLCSCLLSKVKKPFPVKIMARHAKWSAFKNSVIRYQERRGGLYCQMPHPDLSQIPFNWTNERADLISKHSINQGGKVLDAGSHWGTISYTLAQSGFDCLAAEISKHHYRKALKISKFPGKPFKATNCNFLDLDFAGTVLFLNIIHHLLDKDKLDKVKAFLSRNDIKEIFYQSHRPGDKWYDKMSAEDTLSFISRHSNLTNITHLATFNKRRMYHLK